MIPSQPQPPHAPNDQPVVDRYHLGVVTVLQLIMVAELAVSLYEAQWLTAFLVLTIILLTLAPTLLRRRMPVQIPAEFHLLAVVFVFASLFLGEIRSYYERFWWWDLALHGCSGLLLGLLGFLLVYVLNENQRVDLHMRPRFVALFAVVFAIAVRSEERRVEKECRYGWWPDK